MIGNKNIVAIIPARGGSKTLPRKNIINLCGKPVIAYTILAALKSKYINRVIVTTDSKEIAEISKRWGAEVPFLRPKHLAKDTSHTPPVIEHAVKFIEKKGNRVDFIVTLQPTSPLRRTEQIDKVIKLMHKARFDSVVSIRPADYPPYWMVRVKRNKVIPFVNNGINYSLKERQQLPKAYQVNGAIYVTKRDVLLEQGVIITQKNCGFIIMDEITSLDIDTYEDLKRIKMIMTIKKRR